MLLLATGDHLALPLPPTDEALEKQFFRHPQVLPRST